MSRIVMGAGFIAALLSSTSAAYAADDFQIQQLQAQIQQLQQQLNRLAQNQTAPPPAPITPTAAAPTPQLNQQSNANAFNPAISAVLNGHLGSFSGDNNDLAGFALGEEAGRINNGLSTDESELNVAANVDDLFAGSLTASFNQEDGETGVELEEAYLRTLGLPYGLGIKLGRSLLPVGYLNEHHSHTDDFADRPLPNRAFLGNSYKDDGALVSWLLPTKRYIELGGGAFRGIDFPGGGDHGNDAGAYLGYARVGGDIGKNQSYLVGGSVLSTHPNDRTSNDGALIFNGDDLLYTASLRYIWNPTGNATQKQVTLQGEYFWRSEDGDYNDTILASGAVPYDKSQSGFYVQGVYKFKPRWRIGARYSQLEAGDVPAGLTGSALDSDGHDPWNAALMVDWTHSEFSRLRLQYAYEEARAGDGDNQFVLQYIASLGAHPAHTF